MMQKRRVCIVGANGYSGQELCTLLARHAHVGDIVLASQRYAGKRLSEVFPRFSKNEKIAKLSFVPPLVPTLLDAGVEVVFLAVPAEVAIELAPPLLEAGVRVIDVSAGFRLRDAEKYREFYGIEHPVPHLLAEAVYGLPEWNADFIRSARLVACPGCYPTSILLALLPLVSRSLIQADTLCISSVSGVSGAGRTPEISLLFGECDGSFRAYGLPKHRHVAEIEQELNLMIGDEEGKEVHISFVPHLLPAHRGIHTTIFVRPELEEDFTRVFQAWEDDYARSTFIRVSDTLPDIKNVNMTNFCDLAARLDERTGQWLIFSAIDNLVKGAAGQALQCFNLMYGFDEIEGLRA